MEKLWGLLRKLYKWTDKDIIVAYALYCITPMKNINIKNQVILKVAEKMNLSPASLILRMKNFKFLDTKSKGLGHVAKLDQKIFEEFKQNWGQLSLIAEEITGLSLFDTSPINGSKPISSLTHKSLVSRERHAFRASIFANYEGACAISGITVPSLLIASHLKPYNRCRSQAERTSIRNGVLLSPLYDMALDKGLITIDKNLYIHVSHELDIYTNSGPLRKLEGVKLRNSRFTPSLEFIEFHNMEVFRA